MLRPVRVCGICVDKREQKTRANDQGSGILTPNLKSLREEGAHKVPPLAKLGHVRADLGPAVEEGNVGRPGVDVGVLWVDQVPFFLSSLGLLPHLSHLF